MGELQWALPGAVRDNADGAWWCHRGGHFWAPIGADTSRGSGVWQGEWRQTFSAVCLSYFRQTERERACTEHVFRSERQPHDTLWCWLDVDTTCKNVAQLLKHTTNKKIHTLWQKRFQDLNILVYLILSEYHIFFSVTENEYLNLCLSKLEQLAKATIGRRAPRLF